MEHIITVLDNYQWTEDTKVSTLINEALKANWKDGKPEELLKALKWYRDTINERAIEREEKLKKIDIKKIKARYDLSILYAELLALSATMELFTKEKKAVDKIADYLKDKPIDFFGEQKKKENREVITYQFWKFYRVFQFKEFISLMFPRICIEKDTITTPGNRIVQMIDEAFLWLIANQSSDNRLKYVQNYFSEEVMNMEIGDHITNLKKESIDVCLGFVSEKDDSLKINKYGDYIKQTLDLESEVIEYDTKFIDEISKLSIEDKTSIVQLELIMKLAYSAKSINEKEYSGLKESIIASNAIDYAGLCEEFKNEKGNTIDPLVKLKVVIKESKNWQDWLKTNKPKLNITSTRAKDRPWDIYLMLEFLKVKGDVEKISEYMYERKRSAKLKEICAGFTIKNLFDVPNDIGISILDRKKVIDNLCIQKGYNVQLDHTVSRKKIKMFIELTCRKLYHEHCDTNKIKIINEDVDKVVKYIFGCLLHMDENTFLNRKEEDSLNKKTKKQDENETESQTTDIEYNEINDFFVNLNEAAIFEEYKNADFTIYHIPNHPDEDITAENARDWLKTMKVIGNGTIDEKHKINSPFDIIDLVDVNYRWNGDEDKWQKIS